MADRRLPVPGDAEQKEAMKLARDLYKDEYTEAKTAKEKQALTALAKKILAKAEETAADPVGPFVLFRLACDVAVEAADAETALGAIDAMAGRYRVDDAVERKTEVLGKVEEAVKKTRAPVDHAALAKQARQVIDEAVAANKFQQARQLGPLARREAAKTRDKELIAAVRARVQEVEEAAKAFSDYEAAKRILDENPREPKANQTVGEYLCTVKGDWKQGLPYLANGNDDNLKTLAEREVSSPPLEAHDQKELADAWEDFGRAIKGRGKKKNAILLHAGAWYERALTGLSGLPKEIVEKRLEEIAKNDRSEPAPARPLPKLVFGKWFPLLISRNELVGWNLGNADVVYSNAIIELRNGTIEFPVVVKDVAIRAKAKKLPGENICLRLRGSNKTGIS